MSISPLSALTSASAPDPADLQGSLKQTKADFQAISSALQSGDISGAQQAFAQLQKDNPRLAQALSSAPSSSDSPRIADLKSLASALKSGDLSGAQQAFSKLQQDVKSAGSHHHRHHAAATPAAAPATGTDADGDNDGSTTTGTALNVSA
jgi:hypothetical protein